MTPEQIRNLMHIAAAQGDLKHYERLERMLENGKSHIK